MNKDFTMFLHLRRANEALRALPMWAKLVIATQCLLPGAVLWYQMKFLAYKSLEFGQLLGMMQEMKTLSETHYQQLMPLFGDAIQAGMPGTASFAVLVYLNVALMVLGFCILILILMTWKPKTKYGFTN